MVGWVCMYVSRWLGGYVFFKFLLLHAPLNCVILHAGCTFISCYVIRFYVGFCPLLFNSGLEVVDC